MGRSLPTCLPSTAILLFSHLNPTKREPSMSAIIVLILRVFLALALYFFLGWAFFTVWRELRAQSVLVSTQRIPPIMISWVNASGETINQQFASPEIIIGRDPSCELIVSDEMVSARHARLSYHSNQWWVEDLQS